MEILHDGGEYDNNEAEGNTMYKATVAKLVLNGDVKVVLNGRC